MNGYFPEGVEALELAKVVHLDDHVIAVEQERAFLLVHNVEEVAEALIRLEVEVDAVH